MAEHPTAASRRAVLASTLLALTAGVWPLRVQAAPEVQERILVIGDSQAQGLAGGIQRLYRSDRSRKVTDLAKVSTGLMPRVNYDWPAQAKTFANAAHYDVAFMLIGANDRPPVHSGGHVDPNRLATFSDTYGAKVTEIADTFKRANIPLVWVGHPIVRDAVWAEDVSILNTIFGERVPEAGETFFPTWDMFKGPDGGFAQYGKGLDGLTTRLRLDDGVHLTPAGYDMLASALAPIMDRYRPATPAAATASSQ